MAGPPKTDSGSGGSFETAPGPSRTLTDDSPTTFISQNITTHCEIEGEEYYVLNATVSSTKWEEADMVEATVVAADDTEPTRNREFRLDVKGRRVFTGTVMESSLNEDNQWEVKAMDAMLPLINHTQSMSVEDPTPISTLIKSVLSKAGVDRHEIDLLEVGEGNSLMLNPDDSRAVAVDYRLRNKDFAEMTGANLVTKLAQLANAMWWVDRHNRVRVGTPDSKFVDVEYVLESSAGKTSPPYRGVVVSSGPTASEYGAGSSHLIQLNGDVVKRGLFHGHGPEPKKAHGEITVVVPYSSVIREGWQFGASYERSGQSDATDLIVETTERREVTVPSDMDNKEVTLKVRATETGSIYNLPANADWEPTGNTGAQLDKISNPRPFEGGLDADESPQERWYVQEGETNEPVFYVKDRQITTKKEAEMMANAIIDKFLEYVQGGDVKIVGDETIDKLDAIQMPAVMGSDKYMVESVEHELDGSDGFTTKIKVGALLPGHYEDVPGVGSYGGDLQL